MDEIIYIFLTAVLSIILFVILGYVVVILHDKAERVFRLNKVIDAAMIIALIAIAITLFIWSTNMYNLYKSNIISNREYAVSEINYRIMKYHKETATEEEEEFIKLQEIIINRDIRDLKNSIRHSLIKDYKEEITSLEYLPHKN